MDLKTRLKMLIDEREISPYTLSKISGVPQPTIHRILAGTSSSPRDSNVQKLAAGLQVSEAELRGMNESASSTLKEGLTPEEVKGLSAWRTLSSGVTPEEIKVLSALRELSTEEQEHVRKLIDLLMKSGKSSA